MTPVASSITAWGRGRPLREAFEDAVMHAKDGIVSVSIGARPDKDWQAILSATGVTLVAHHAVPFSANGMLRPATDADELVDALVTLGIGHYSAHPPLRRDKAGEEFMEWALAWNDRLGAEGITFAVETMYPARDRTDAGFDGGWHLDSPASVAAFLDMAQAHGWKAPLVVDAAHLHIGVTSGMWSLTDVVALTQRCATSGACAEAHVSANDGVRDKHRAFGGDSTVDDWVWAAARACKPNFIVDEARQ